MDLGEAAGHIILELRATPWWKVRRISQLRTTLRVLAQMHRLELEGRLDRIERAAKVVGAPDILADVVRLRSLLKGYDSNTWNREEIGLSNPNLKVFSKRLE